MCSSSQATKSSQQWPKHSCNSLPKVTYLYFMTCYWWLVTGDGSRTHTRTSTSSITIPAICNSATCQAYRTIIESIVASHCNSWLPDALSLISCSSLPHPTIFYFTLLCPCARTQVRTTKTETMSGMTLKRKCWGPRLLTTSSCCSRSPSCLKCSLKYALPFPAILIVETDFTVVQFIYLSYL